MEPVPEPCGTIRKEIMHGKETEHLILTDVSPEEYRRRGGGNYLKKQLAVSALLQPGKIYQTHIFHDDWCALLARTGPCNCDPDIEMREVVMP
jgi:hypothetical protein